jgi:hypothetical protein
MPYLVFTILVDAPSITVIPGDFYEVDALDHLLTFVEECEDIAAIWWIQWSLLYGQNSWSLIWAVLICKSLTKRICFFSVFVPRAYGQSHVAILIGIVYFDKNSMQRKPAADH